MIFVPAIYFSFLSFLLYRRNKCLDIATLIAAMFAVSGIFSVLVDVFDLRYWDSVGYQITPVASAFYCGLVTMCILPFAACSNVKITRIRPIRNKRVLKVVAWISLAWFLASLLFGWESMMRVLTGDMGEMRSGMATESAEKHDWMLSLPSGLRLVITVFNMIFSCSWSLVFLAFFSRYVQKMDSKYFYAFIIASLSGPFQGIVIADRSKTAYWILTLVGMYLLFRPWMTKTEKKSLRRFGTVMVAILSTYLVAMTISRFGWRDAGNNIGGTEGGIVSYLGQVYINFCYFFDSYEPAFTHLGIIFPFTSQYVFGVPSGGTTIQEQMNFLTGHNTNVFYTFIGQIIIGAGREAAIVYSIAYTIISAISLPRIVRRKALGISGLYIYFALSSVLLLGLFGHYYTAAPLTCSLVVMFLLVRLMENEK